MQEIVSLIILGITLSMDTFSLSIGISSILNDTFYYYLFPIIVGIFHFIMPIIGNMIGMKIIYLLSITNNILLGCILLFLDFSMLKSYLKDEKTNIELNIIKIIILAISVSFDSFSVGLGISSVTNSIIMASVIFSIISFSFTKLGLIIGKYNSKILGKKSELIGIILLFILAIFHIFK